MKPFDPALEQRQRRQVELIYALGTPAVLHCMRDLAAGADLDRTLRLYANLPAAFILDMGGDRFPRPIALVCGDAS